MTDREALLAAILDDPECDTARLVYADYLQENGEGERGEFIRVQCRIATINAELQSEEDCGNDDCCGERRVLRARERELFNNRCRVWFPNPIGSEFKWLLPDEQWDKSASAMFSRGFVSSISCSCADFLQHAAAIWRENPVTAVSISDREPYHNGAGFGWFRAGRNSRSELVPTRAEIPDELMREIRTRQDEYYDEDGSAPRWLAFSTPGAARDSLSAACVHYGRARARAARGTVGVGTQPEAMR